MFVSFSHRFLPFASNAGIKAYRCQAFVVLCRWRKAIASTFALRLFPADLSLIRQRGDSDVAAVIPPSRGLPPVEFCRGTKPSQAANSGPERKTFGSATVVAMAVAMSAQSPECWPAAG